MLLKGSTYLAYLSLVVSKYAEVDRVGNRLSSLNEGGMVVVDNRRDMSAPLSCIGVTT